MFLVGIDLGTTHSALAFTRPEASAPVEDFSVPQWVRPGEHASRPLLPSFVYLPGADEKLTGNESEPRIVGELARWQGARVPGRLIASAKSWLCHSGVDRQAAILPWGAAAEIARISPVEASAAILQHLRAAWDQAHPDSPLRAQEVVLTVPASFDEAARSLTVAAARQAGLERFVLLEEPQAAFYDFTARHSAPREASRATPLAQALAGVRLVLVVDVGGGTTDFTLVQAEVTPEGPSLRRVAVGNHLLLGGDNMDAALAHAAETRLSPPQKLPAAQWQLLVQAARLAKESLLGANPPERERFSGFAGGSQLLGNSWTSELSRADVEMLVLDGFFPAVTPEDRPRASAARLALQAQGLPYAADPAITRHLVGFLAAHATASFAALGRSGNEGELPRPDAILLNGGVFNSPRIAQRLVETVSALFPGQPAIPLLDHGSLDRAVARGAAFYGKVRHGMGLRISGGAARAFYLALRAPRSGSANSEESAQAVCVAPRGFEEGSSVRLERPFVLKLGEPVQFPLLSTSSDRIDTAGDLVTPDDTFLPLPPLHAVLTRAGGARGEVKVWVETSLTEIGTLELACVTSDEPRADGPLAAERWRLEFELRGSTERAALTSVESMPARFVEARDWVDRIFGHKPLPGNNPKDVKQLFRALEKELGPRMDWRAPVLRELWGPLFSGAAKRRRSPDHERVFFQLLGFSLRPGFGYPLDAWRAEQSFRLFKEGVQFHTEIPNWVEFWVLWRRMAGGLMPKAQAELWSYLRPHLERKLEEGSPRPFKPTSKTTRKPKGIQPEGLEEMVRTAASLEHLLSAEKVELGGWIIARIGHDARGGPWAWALGRLGARLPVYGSGGTGHLTVSPEVATQWLERLLELGLDKLDGAPFAAMQLARRTDDRTRDLDADMRDRVRAELSRVKAPERWIRLMDEAAPLDAQDDARLLGDTLPAGLAMA